MSSTKSAIEQVFDFLASVKLALFTLITLAIAAIGGTIIPQNLHPEQYIQGYGPKLYTFLSYLDMFDMYSSWWFTLLMALLVINLVICSINRLPGTMRLAKPARAEKLSAEFLKKQSFSEVIKVKGNPDSVLSNLKKDMAGIFSRPNEITSSWGKLLWAEKGAFSRYGVYLVHFSILFFIIGGLVGGKYGFSAYINMSNGQKASRVMGREPAGMINLPFTIHLDRFIVKFYDTGTPSHFESFVTIIEDGKEVLEDSISVNHPLTYRGITFYQSGWSRDQVGPFKVRATNLKDNKSYDLVVHKGRPVELPDKSGAVGVMEFMENIMRAGPAVRLVVQQKNEQAYAEWAFMKKPDGMPEPKSNWSFDLKDYKVTYASGFQVNKDPGVVFIWIGCGMMLIGFIVTFFFSHRKMFIGIISKGKNTEVILAGSSHRNQGSYKVKFDRMAERVADRAASGDNE